MSLLSSFVTSSWLLSFSSPMVPGGDNQEQLLYQIITEAGNKGTSSLFMVTMVTMVTVMIAMVAEHHTSSLTP